MNESEKDLFSENAENEKVMKIAKKKVEFFQKKI